MPVPVFVSAMMPVVFWMTPENVLLALPAPTSSVYVPVPERLSIVPAPESAPTSRLKPCRSRRPPLATVVAPVLAPSAKVLPSCRVPLPTVVPPL